MSGDESEGRRSRRVPIPALVLGGAGLLPPLLAIIVRLSEGGGGTDLARFAMLLGLGYVSLILSFLGGAWWGIAAARVPGDRIGAWLGMAVAPSLIAFALQVVSGWFPHTAAILLGVAVAASLLVDRRLAADGLAPRWWMRLRVPLSAGLAVLTLGLAALL